MRARPDSSYRLSHRRLPALTALAAVALLLSSAPAPLAAQSQWEVPRDEPGQYQRPPEAQEAIDQLKSPYCPGLMLEVCPSPGGAALRDSLSQLAEEGWTSDQLVDWVIANHGEQWRALPKAEGRSLVAWVVPPLGLALGLFLVVWALRRMRKDAPDIEPLDHDLSDEEEARLREAMKELDEEEEATFF